MEQGEYKKHVKIYLSRNEDQGMLSRRVNKLALYSIDDQKK